MIVYDMCNKPHHEYQQNDLQQHQDRCQELNLPYVLIEACQKRWTSEKMNLGQDRQHRLIKMKGIQILWSLWRVFSICGKRLLGYVRMFGKGMGYDGVIDKLFMVEWQKGLIATVCLSLAG